MRNDSGHPAALVALVVFTLIAMGGFLREFPGLLAADAAADDGVRVLGIAETRGDFPGTVTVLAGATYPEVLEELNRAGIDTELFQTLVREPGWLGLEGSLWEAASVELMLFPGEYVVRTANPQPLIEQMVDRLFWAADDEVRAAARDRGMTLAELVERAGAVQGITGVTAEMPVVAEMLVSRPADAPTRAAPTAAALRAVVWPSALGIPPAVGTNGPTLVSGLRTGEARPADDLESVLVREAAGAEGRVAYAVGRDGVVEAGVDADAFFETAGLEVMAVAYAAETLIADGVVDPSARITLRPELLTRELPIVRAVLGAADVRNAIDVMIDFGSVAATVAVIDAIGVDRLEEMLRSSGILSTSLRSRPMITTATNTLRLAQLLDEIGSSGETTLDRLLARGEESWMTGPLVERAGFSGLAVERPGAFHEIGRFASAEDGALLVQLSDASTGTHSAARRAAHATALHAAEYVVHFGDRSTSCEFPGAEAGALFGTTVALDPGHGGEDPGSIHVFDDGVVLHEATVNLAIALDVKDQLVASGVRVVMTRCDDESAALGSRAYVVNRSGAQLVISLHVDDLPDPTFNRSKVVSYTEESTVLSRLIAGDETSGLTPAVVGTHDIPRVGRDREPLALLVMALPPAALVEVSALSYPQEAAELRAALLGESTRISVIGLGVADGVVTALEAMAG